MNPIDGIHLQDLLKETIEATRQRKIQVVANVIEVKLAELERAEKQVVNAKKDLEKASEKRDNLQTFIEAVRTGNWGVIRLPEIDISDHGSAYTNMAEVSPRKENRN